jgi:hypothetical protein
MLVWAGVLRGLLSIHQRWSLLFGMASGDRVIPQDENADLNIPVMTTNA